MIYAGEWELGTTHIRNHCLAYQIVLDSPEYVPRLMGKQPVLGYYGIAETLATVAFAKSILNGGLESAMLLRACDSYVQGLSAVSSVNGGQWRAQLEFQAVQAALLALICADFDLAQRLLSVPGNFVVHGTYRDLFLKVSQSPYGEEARKAFTDHFRLVADMTGTSTWSRPEGCADGQYRFTCGVLFARMEARWQVLPNWREVCDAISSDRTA